MEIEKMLEIIIVALACPICIPLVLEDDKSKAEKNPRISIQQI